MARLTLIIYSSDGVFVDKFDAKNKQKQNSLTAKSVRLNSDSLVIFERLGIDSESIREHKQISNPNISLQTVCLSIYSFISKSIHHMTCLKNDI